MIVKWIRRDKMFERFCFQARTVIFGKTIKSLPEKKETCIGKKMVGFNLSPELGAFELGGGK